MAIRVERSISDEGDGQENRIAASSAKCKGNKAGWSFYQGQVSTTHVSVGSLFGIGLVTRQVDFRVIVSIVLSWILTLPVAAILAGGSYWLLNVLWFSLRKLNV